MNWHKVKRVRDPMVSLPLKISFVIAVVSLAIVFVLLPNLFAWVLKAMFTLLGLIFLILMGILLWLHPGRLITFCLVAGITECMQGAAWLWHRWVKPAHHPLK
jgi:hypothetical protein